MVAESAMTDRIDAYRAAQIALDFVRKMFQKERITNVGLEEVRLTDEEWRITVGFSRPWELKTRLKDSLLDFSRLDPLPPRAYKVVKIDAADGTVRGLEIRERAQ